MKITSRFSIILALLLLVGCSSSKPVSMVDESFDFAGIRTFDFVPVPSTDGEAYESLETNYLRSAMTRELQARGIRQSSEADVMVNFSISTEEKIRSRSVPSMGGYVGGYDYYDDVYYDGWARTHQTRIDQYTEGRLNIDVIDPVGRKLVWQGSTSGRLTNEMMSNFRATLDEAVTEIMGEFPVALPGAE